MLSKTPEEFCDRYRHGLTAIGVTKGYEREMVRFKFTLMTCITAAQRSACTLRSLKPGWNCSCRRVVAVRYGRRRLKTAGLPALKTSETRTIAVVNVTSEK